MKKRHRNTMQFSNDNGKSARKKKMLKEEKRYLFGA